MSTPKWLRPVPSRTVQLLLLIALPSASAFAFAAPTPFIVNAYYGDSNGSTLLSSLILSRATARLTHLTYAFATSDQFSNPCTGAPPTMNYTDLQNLKTQNPNLKVLISVGGAFAYGVFVNAASSPQAITSFANNCVTTLMQSFPGYVNGIDIDWEFPQNATDEKNLNLILAAFRSALDTYASNNNLSHLLLTAAIGPQSTPNGWQFVDFTGAHYSPSANSSVDFYNLEFYNYAYNNDGVTESNAPIHSINDDIFGNAQAYGAAGLIPVGGVPASKIVLGIPFYGVHYTGVTNGMTLGKPATLDSPDSASGTPTYAQIVSMIAASPALYQSFSDTDGSVWTWRSSTGGFWEYDNATAITQKIQYAQNHQLGGIMSWNLQQDTSSGTLLNAMMAPAAAYTNVTGSFWITSPAGLAYNKIKHTATQTFSLTNTSGASISGPIQFVLSGLPSGVTATGNSCTFSSSPYWTVTSSSTASGASLQFTVTLAFTGTPTISATPTVYSGSLQ